MKHGERAVGRFGWSVAVVLAGAGMAQANMCTNTFKYTAANTPRTAYDYFAVTNWTDEAKGVPDGWNASATLPLGTKAYFVSAAEAPKLSRFTFNQRSYYLGDIAAGTHQGVAVNGGGNSHASLVNGHLDDGSYIFGTLTHTMRANSKGAYYGSYQLAGHFRPGATVDGASGANYAHTGMMVMRMDLFADDTNPVRTEPYHYYNSFIENGGFTLVGPRGAAAQTSAWNLEAGSPYIQYAGEGLHGVVPGVTVTGAGIPAGTFVKYVFARTGWIALSEPVAANGTASNVSLQFGAITPSVSQYWPDYWQHNVANRRLRVVKYRPEDGCTFVIGKVRMTDPGSETSSTIWGLEKAMLDVGYLPGDIVISNLVSESKLFYRKNQLDTVNIRFAGNISDASMATNAASHFYWHMPTATAVAHLAVDAEKTANLYNLKDVKGRIVKDGEGTLLCRVADTTLAGKLEVTAGTLEIARTTETTGQTITVSNLTLAAGAALKLPADGLTVVNLTAAPGATVTGPGTLTVTGTINGTPFVDGGASLNVALKLMTRAARVAPFAPWFNMDASAAATLTTVARNGTNFITKITDAGGSGEYVKPYLTGNDNQPWIVPAATNGMPFIDLGPFSSTNGVAPGSLRYPDRALKLYGTNDVEYYGGREITGSGATVGDNTPRKPAIHTAFFAVNTAQGGGSLLGASRNDYANFGLVHGRDFLRSGETVVPIHCFDKPSYESTYRSITAKAKIDSGATMFRVNGQGVYPQTDSYSGNYDIISMRFDDNMRSSEFGHFYQSASKNYENSANGFAFGEYILFTNKLDMVTVEEIEAYLQYKWYGRRTAGSFAEAASVRVGAGSTLSVTGSDGTLYAQGLTPAGGTIAGNVKLAEEGVITVEISPTGTLAGMTVEGTLALPSSGSVVFSGDVRALQPGEYPICAATAVTGDVTAWTMPQRKSLSCTLQVKNNVLTLIVPHSGMVILFR